MRSIAAVRSEDSVSPECQAAIAQAEYVQRTDRSDFTGMDEALDYANAVCADDFETD
jgi:hypothetical protein